MGTWSASITGNDTASDLKSEYKVAFHCYDVDTALSKIDAYVRNEGFDESDEGEWCDYYYSLANFMWDKGLLTVDVRDEAVRLIDTNYGIEIWKDSGIKTFKERKKVLKNFKDKLISPQPTKKR